MKKPLSCFQLFVSGLLVFSFGVMVGGHVPAATLADERALPYLILWNVSEKTGQVLPMTAAADDRYALVVPVLKGQYTYRVAIGPQKNPIYGAEGNVGGTPITLEIEENRRITFGYDANTHLMTTDIGETFMPPKKVVLVGNLQDEFGHTGGQFGGEWDPSAETTRMQDLGHGLFAFTGTLPAGTYEYKVAIGGSWKENYGQGGKQDGPNISVQVDKAQDVTFYYHDVSHKIADSTWYRQLPEDELPRLVGDVQETAGTALILRDDDFDQVYSLSAPLPKGRHSYRVAIGAAQQPIYGANAVRDGDPITFRIAEDREVIFFFDARPHESFFDDGSLNDGLMKHDTYSLRFRSPFEALPAGQAVTLRLQTRSGDLQSAKLRLGKARIVGKEITYGVADQTYAMSYVETQSLPEGGAVDLWEVTVPIPEPGLYGYKFMLNDLKEYGDDAITGGVGTAAFRGTDYFHLTVYAADFKTPDWMKGAIVYQIFPDRFFNGNPANDTAKTQARGAEPVTLHAWTDLPATPGLNDADPFFNNDFFGGDLEGIRQKLDYFQSLGVTVLYLNPIFTAGSNHKYDSANYDQIDPMFGTDAEFQALINELHARGMYLILDGVFNHVGDDSIYFDRYGKYAGVGAYEYWSRVFDRMNAAWLRTADAKMLVEQELATEGQQLSPYRWHNWFAIRNARVQNHYDYQGWAGYDSLPAIKEFGPGAVAQPLTDHASELNNREWADYILLDENSVAKRWIKHGIAGWRMDVADEVDGAVWQAFRQELKPMTLPSGEAPLLLAEIWSDAAHFFLGDTFDSVMNYGFRHAVLTEFLLNGDAAAADAVFRSLRQNYPPEAFYTLMNLIGSHDTARAIYLLGGGADTRLLAEKGTHFDYELGKWRLTLAAIFQMGFPGAATVYYGDEAGQFGSRDPDCRRRAVQFSIIPL